MKKIKQVLEATALAIVLCLVLLSANSASAQNKKVEIYGNKLEKKADKFNYTVYDRGERYYLHNKNNSLMIYESSKETKSKFQQLNWGDYIEFHGRKNLDTLVYNYIASFYKQYKSKYSETFTEFAITLFAKPDGKVCELAFSYSKDGNIPFRVIEELEKDILGSGLKLDFDSEHYYFNDAIWVDWRVMYSVSKMKEKLKSEKK